MTMKIKYPKICLILSIIVFSASFFPNYSNAFTQGQCGQRLKNSIILTKDIGPCDGVGVIINKNGITLDGNGHKIIGSGYSDGIFIDGNKNITIQNVIVKEFSNGISIKRGNDNIIKATSLSYNNVGLAILSTNTMVSNNMIYENKIGVSVNFPNNSIIHNILANNEHQIEDLGGNRWDNYGFGNYWSNYWGQDDGSDGRKSGDFVGDTFLPHEGVDFFPLLDPSIPEQFGPLMCADWWLLWTGGWSPVAIQVVDPFGRIISKEVNQIGENAFYVEETDQLDYSSQLIRVLIHRPCLDTPTHGIFSFRMEGLDQLDYSMMSLASQRGQVILKHLIKDGVLKSGETQNIDIRLIENVGTGGEITASAKLSLPIDIKPGSNTNSIQINSVGVIPVAILSLPTFDATMINPDTIYLEAASIKLVGNTNKTISHAEDINGDGLPDLICQILTEELQVITGQAVAILEGLTFDGTPIHGEDVIRIVSN
jgi:hypothetical protein